MKKQNLIKESQGLIDKDGIQWYDLSDLITEYIFDLQNGLNADPFVDDEPTITRGNIESYYQYINKKKMPDYTIPKWVGKFKLLLLNNKRSAGTFLKGKAELSFNRKKLNFEIELRSDLNPDDMNNTIVHEFQHAYSYWLEKTKNFTFANYNKAQLYNKSLQAFDFNKYPDTMPTATLVSGNYVNVNNEIFNNAKSLERAILQSFYMGSIGEIRSYTQEFASDIMRQIKKNFNKVRNEIKDAQELKKDYSLKTADEQWRSNILNNLSITCNNSIYYLRYKTYYKFFKALEKTVLDDDIATEVVTNIKKPIRLFLKKSVTTKLVNFEGDAENILKQIARKQIPIYEMAIKKMEKIFAKLIMDIPV